MKSDRYWMPSPTDPAYVALLLAEDEVIEARLLQRYLIEDLGRHYDIKVDLAISRAGARRFIDAAEEAGAAYNGAILDYKLPDEDHGNSYCDVSLTRYAASKPETVRMILQNSAFVEDRTLREFWQDCAGKGVRSNLFDKGDPESTREMTAWIRQGLIEEELTKPMLTPWFRAEVGASAKPLVRGRVGRKDFDLRYFTSRLKLLWPHLDQATRDLAKQFFELRFESDDINRLETIGLKDFQYKSD